MFLKFLFLTLLLLLPLLGSELKSSYYVNSNEIRLSDIIKEPKQDAHLLSLDRGKSIKKIKLQELLKLLEKHGYKDYTSKSRFIKFTKKSPINVQMLQSKVSAYYKEKYREINIKNIIVTPRSYTASLPKNYEIVFASKSHLFNKGTFYIKTLQKKKLFFDYLISATLNVVVSKIKIRRNEELSYFNIKKKSVPLSKFRALPLQKIQKNSLESKRQMKVGTIITQRDVQALSLVKRGQRVSVTLNNNGIAISFSAKAQKNGRINDIITILKSDGKKLKARVTGKNRVEIQ